MGIITKVRETGLLYSLAIVFNRVIPAWLFRHRKFVVLEIDPSQFDGKAEKTLVAELEEQVVFARANQTELVSQVSKVTLVDTAGAGDAQPWAARENGQTIGGLWIAEALFAESDLGVAIELSTRQAWLFGARIIEERRGNGIYSRFVAHVCAEFKAGSRILLAVNPHNKRSFTVHQKFATRTVGTVRATRFLGAVFVLPSRSIQLNSRCSVNCNKRPVIISFPEKPE